MWPTGLPRVAVFPCEQPTHARQGAANTLTPPYPRLACELPCSTGRPGLPVSRSGDPGIASRPEVAVQAHPDPW
jgi:hypothetical protein